MRSSTDLGPRRLRLSCASAIDWLGSGVVPANQTEESEVRELSGKQSELVLENPFACKCYTKPLKKGVPELIPDSFPESSRLRLALPKLLLMGGGICCDMYLD